MYTHTYVDHHLQSGPMTNIQLHLLTLTVTSLTLRCLSHCMNSWSTGCLVIVWTLILCFLLSRLLMLSSLCSLYVVDTPFDSSILLTLIILYWFTSYECLLLVYFWLLVLNRVSSYLPLFLSYYHSLRYFLISLHSLSYWSCWWYFIAIEFVIGSSLLEYNNRLPNDSSVMILCCYPLHLFYWNYLACQLCYESITLS